MLRFSTQIISKNFLSNVESCIINNNIKRFYASLYNPPYLELMKKKHPTYDVINVKMTGYDFTVLESYHKFVHKIAKSLDLEIEESWAHPPKKTKIIRYKPNSTNIEAEYSLTAYERYIQLADVESPIYPVFLRFIQAAIPEGIKLSVVHHTDLTEESRYVPDKELLDLKAQLEAAGGPLKTRK
ncbi:hypothetical protein PVAND_011470 [Polypedilum vanderplanki]|uniref:Small ribosomal subunit protein uS10 domain-containing protein n=1 Tax=Polypedilum vanderplanki TaxID=319348 RepID=A0A9J6CK74_POLVA|nr:hypothetical protein PVAND_011470 [Polypedilum vanderplanki]